MRIRSYVSLLIATFIVAVFLLITVTIEVDALVPTTLLGIGTFLFSIYVSFTISERHQRIERLRTAASNERGELVNIFQLTRNINDPDYQERVTNRIDEYLQAVLEHDVHYYYRTNTAFETLVQEIHSAQPKEGKEANAYGSIMWGLMGLTKAREEQKAVIGDRISKLEWFVIALLAGVIILSLIALNTGSLVSIIIIGAFILVIDLLIALLIYLDNLKWKVEQRVVEPYEKVFDAIGVPRYYTNYMVTHSQATMRDEKANDYRIARFPNYPSFEGKEVELIEKGEVQQ